jgi:hypothetical protein
MALFTSCFPDDIDNAHGVYELTSHALRYANLEVDFGDPLAARPLLANAEGLLGDTDLVLNTKAHMMLREAISIGSHAEAPLLRKDAESILKAQMERAGD